MIDINELRQSLGAIQPEEVAELLDRLEAAEKEVESLRQGVAFRDDVVANLAVERDAMRAKISDLTVNVEYLGNLKKSYEELIGDLQDERDALRVEVERLTECLHRANAQAEHFEREWYLRGDEVDALCTKIEQMERQEPVAWMLNCPTLGGDTGWILSWTQSGAGLCNRLSGEENEKKLYALPGAKGE